MPPFRHDAAAMIRFSPLFHFFRAPHITLMPFHFAMITRLLKPLFAADAIISPDIFDSAIAAAFISPFRHYFRFSPSFHYLMRHFR
jgi:hypothetical protein